IARYWSARGLRQSTDRSGETTLRLSLELLPEEALHLDTAYRNRHRRLEQLALLDEAPPVSERTNHAIWDPPYAAVRGGAAYPVSLDDAIAVMQVLPRAKEGTGFQDHRSPRVCGDSWYTMGCGASASFSINGNALRPCRHWQGLFS
ncbi:MAG: hypothetical protein MUQ30_18480, partial [Anaerolineae bacterium]|nr:hypothetical protein [Anaerolineae bacterium]